MPLDKERADQLEYETLRERLNTRENSTLTFSTVTASASFILLSFFVNSNQSSEDSFFFLGIIFTFLGIIYRESTIFTIDRVESKRLRQLESELIGRKIPRPSFISLTFRRFLVPFYLWMALSAWLIVKLSLPFLPLILLGGVLPSLVLAIAYDP